MAPKKSDDWALKHDAQGFASGAASMFMRESWVIPFVKKNGPDIKFGVVPVPRDKAFGAFNAVEVLSVNKDSKLKDAAWDFIRILQDQAIVNNVLESSGWVPLRRDRDYCGGAGEGAALRPDDLAAGRSGAVHRGAERRL